MFVKDALEEEVGIVVELCGAVWRDFQPGERQTWQSESCGQQDCEEIQRNIQLQRLNKRINITVAAFFPKMTALRQQMGCRGSTSALIQLNTHSPTFLRLKQMKVVCSLYAKVIRA